MSLKHFIKTQVLSSYNKERIVFLIGVVSIFFSSIISVFAANYLYSSSEVSFDNSSSGISSDNVQGAIDELYQNASDYSSLDSRIGVLEGRWKNGATSVFNKATAGDGLEVGKTNTSGNTYIDLYYNNKIRANLYYTPGSDKMILNSSDESGASATGALEIRGKSITLYSPSNGNINLNGNVKVNGTSIGDMIKVTTTTFTTKTKAQLNAHSGAAFSNLLTSLPSVTAPSGYTLVGNVHVEITGLPGIIGIFDDINNATKTSSIGGYAFNTNTVNISSGSNIQVRIISLWKKS